jgi:hypothetical protein
VVPPSPNQPLEARPEPVTPEVVSPEERQTEQERRLEEWNQRQKRVGGRPTRLTDDLQEMLVQLIEMGTPADTAVRSLGLAASTYYGWMQEGRDAMSGRRREFFIAIEQAKAKAQNRMVGIVSIAAERDWRAAAFWLERTDPGRWGPMREGRGAFRNPEEEAATGPNDKHVKKAVAAFREALDQYEQTVGREKLLEMVSREFQIEPHVIEKAAAA